MRFGAILADDTRVQPSSFGLLTSGVVSYVRATTPGRGATPARGMTSGEDRQPTTTPSVTTASKPITASAQNDLNMNMGMNMANGWAPKVGGRHVGKYLPVEAHARRSPPAFGLSTCDSTLRADHALAQVSPPNYPKPQPKLKPKPKPKPQPSNSSSPVKSTSKRVTRQGDGTLPGAPDRLSDDAAAVVNKLKKAAAKGKTAKKIARTGSGVTKPKLTAKKSAAKLSDVRSGKEIKVGQAAVPKKVFKPRM